MSLELSNYTLIRIIGKGQFGRVIEVKDNRDKLNYALKAIHPLPEDNEEKLKSLQEAQALAKLSKDKSHDNIVRYFHCWIQDSSEELFTTVKDDDKFSKLTRESSLTESARTSVYSNDPGNSVLQGEMRQLSLGSSSSTSTFVTPTTSDNDKVDLRGNTLFIKTELCQQNFKQWMQKEQGFRQKGILPLLQLFFQAAVALKYIHMKELIHKDLKPENIFVRKNGSSWMLKIGDFGLANSIHAQSRVGKSKGYYGTGPYAAPEATSEDIVQKSDVYSLGVIFLEFLYFPSTAHELWDIVDNIKGSTNATSSQQQPFLDFFTAHPVEKTMIMNMLKEISSRPSAREFHVSLKNHRLRKDFKKCSCHC